MQRAITGIFIVIFTALSILGIVFMVHQGDANHDGCLTGGAFNRVCQQNMSALSMIDLHFNALGVLSSATFSNLPAVEGAVFLGIVLALAAFFGASILSRSAAIVIRRRRTFDFDRSLSRQRMAEWFASLNKKDLLLEVRF